MLWKFKAATLLVLMLAACSRERPSAPQPVGSSTRNLAVGQVWTYRNRPVDPGSTLTICRFEDLPGYGRVVHVSIAGVRLKKPGVAGVYYTQLPHAPFSQAAIEASVTELVGEASPPPPQFEAGYRMWQQAHGGIFVVPVAEAVDIFESGLK